ncbi:MAG: replication initiator protein A [Polyangiaceae bacterium]|nr:replication initiator protein A [Polyangiaceae bacterium]
MNDPCPAPLSGAQDSTARADGLPLVVFEEKDQALDDLAFDEMNIVELPFALLTRNTDGIYEMPLSADGRSRLACLKSSGHGLPNALAPRVLLGMMWMWKNGPESGGRTFTVKLRELVERYMYPDRFTTYAPNGELLRSVERQINCIANTRIHTDKWWDRKLKRHQEANVAIISDVKVIDEGGRHRPRRLQVTWGEAFWQSMVERYTKPIDARIVQSLDNPLDLQLYRLLDRQLATKSRQQYSNIVAFARYKLGMRGKTIDAGGRTASSYVAQKLGESLRRLRQERFVVRMTIDRSVDPFSVTFERLANPSPGQKHEVVDDDLPGELVREFFFHAHGVPRDGRRTRVARVDRAIASEWVTVYGLEKAKWMVQRCVKMQRDRGREPILMFRGLRMYENAAAGAFEQGARKESASRELMVEEEIARIWDSYQQALVDLFDGRTGRDGLSRLEAETREELRREMPEKPGFILEAHLRARIHAAKCGRMNAMSEAEFRSTAGLGLAALRDALAARHGADVLGEDGGRVTLEAA